jgi:hypothetical protein
VDGLVYLSETGPDVRAGQFRTVRITKAAPHDLVGDVIGEATT